MGVRGRPGPYSQLARVAALPKGHPPPSSVLAATSISRAGPNPRRFIRRVKKSGWASRRTGSSPRPLPVHPAGEEVCRLAIGDEGQANLFTCRTRRQGPGRPRPGGSSSKLIHLPHKAAGVEDVGNCKGLRPGLFSAVPKGLYARPVGGRQNNPGRNPVGASAWAVSPPRSRPLWSKGVFVVCP